MLLSYPSVKVKVMVMVENRLRLGLRSRLNTVRDIVRVKGVA